MINNIPESVKTIFFKVVAWRNIEAVRDILGFGQCVFGAIGIINLAGECYYFERTNVSKASWKERALKTIEVFGNLSLIGGAATSYPMIQVWQRTTQWLFTPEQMARFLGSNPYLVASRLSLYISIGTIIFGGPSTIKTTYDVYCWMTKKVTPFQQNLQARSTQALATINTIFENTKLFSRYK